MTKMGEEGMRDLCNLLDKFYSGGEPDGWIPPPWISPGRPLFPATPNIKENFHIFFILLLRYCTSSSSGKGNGSEM